MDGSSSIVGASNAQRMGTAESKWDAGGCGVYGVANARGSGKDISHRLGGLATLSQY